MNLEMGVGILFVKVAVQSIFVLFIERAIKLKKLTADSELIIVITKRTYKASATKGKRHRFRTLSSTKSRK